MTTEHSIDCDCFECTNPDQVREQPTPGFVVYDESPEYIEEFDRMATRARDAMYARPRFYTPRSGGKSFLQGTLIHSILERSGAIFTDALLDGVPPMQVAAVAAHWLRLISEERILFGDDADKPGLTYDEAREIVRYLVEHPGMVIEINLLTPELARAIQFGEHDPKPAHVYNIPNQRGDQ